MAIIYNSSELYTTTHVKFSNCFKDLNFIRLYYGSNLLLTIPNFPINDAKKNGLFFRRSPSRARIHCLLDPFIGDSVNQRMAFTGVSGVGAESGFSNQHFHSVLAALSYRNWVNIEKNVRLQLFFKLIQNLQNNEGINHSVDIDLEGFLINEEEFEFIFSILQYDIKEKFLDYKPVLKRKEDKRNDYLKEKEPGWYTNNRELYGLQNIKQLFEIPQITKTRNELINILMSYEDRGFMYFFPTLNLLQLRTNQLVWLLLITHHMFHPLELKEKGIDNDPTLELFDFENYSNKTNPSCSVFYFLSKNYRRDLTDFSVKKNYDLSKNPYFFPFGLVRLDPVMDDRWPANGDFYYQYEKISLSDKHRYETLLEYYIEFNEFLTNKYGYPILNNFKNLLATVFESNADFEKGISGSITISEWVWPQDYLQQSVLSRRLPLVPSLALNDLDNLEYCEYILKDGSPKNLFFYYNRPIIFLDWWGDINYYESVISLNNSLTNIYENKFGRKPFIASNFDEFFKKYPELDEESRTIKVIPTLEITMTKVNGNKYSQAQVEYQFGPYHVDNIKKS